MTRRVRRLTIVLCLALPAAPGVLAAQVVQVPAPGPRVRVVSSGEGTTVGRVYALDADTLVLLAPSGHLTSLPVAGVRRLEVSEGRTPRVESMLKGMGMGTLSGAASGVLGLAVPSLLFGSPCAAGDDFCPSTGEWALLGILLGAPMGLVSGGIAGLLLPPERWRRTPLDAVRLRTPAEGGLGIGVSLGTR